MKKLKKAERYKHITDYFIANQAAAETELVYQNPYQLLIAVILSAQCTDKRVNMLTPLFFERFPDCYKLAKANIDKIFELIKTCSYPNNKSKHLLGMAKMLAENFNGTVPSEVSDLQKLPGVGRKTANVVASVIYRKPVMAVDTHVFRVAKRIGLADKAKTPLAAELMLTENIPSNLMYHAHHWLILHGRYICKARKPSCNNCGLTGFCKYYLKVEKKKVPKYG